MSPEKWGPPIWTLFHTLIEKVNENDKIIIQELFYHIKRICRYLPCPECSQHATRFLDNIKADNIKTKEGLRNTMYIFHNVVNVRKKKPLYKFENISNNKDRNIINVFNNFIFYYKTTGNMKLIADSFQRQLITQNFRNWFLKNFNSFRN
jgi:formylmethanofuran dehydrogenase subunit E-like metal-binding protein